jgi:alkanesulfonate monooxygenase SsuD/methylene tetrahydromethanopterin reductase-like flavin-dependent oxidoreductase (luciferase family)
MELSYFSPPLHPRERAYGETLAEDRDAIVLADRLGYREAFVGERLSDADATISNSMFFLASLLPLTERIRLASYTTMPQIHPAILAIHAATFDHMTRGRFVFGITPGTLDSDDEILEALEDDRVERFLDAIDTILEVWAAEPPYNVSGERWTITTERTFYPEIGLGYVHRPLQSPHPEIVAGLDLVGTGLAAAAGARGFRSLSAPHIHPDHLASQWRRYAAGCAAGGHDADPRGWRVARAVFVAEDADVARDYALRRADSPYRRYFERMGTKLAACGQAATLTGDAGARDLDAAVGALVVAGSVEGVVDRLLALHERVGPFGTLVYTGMDWADPGLARRSMTLMAEEVMPRVNAALGASRAAAAGA